MTQETFLEHAKHFVSNLPDDHGPVFLTLDGHVSRWNVRALNYLMKNQVLCFFLLSHTSMWSQPNDVGSMKDHIGALNEKLKKKDKC